MSSKTGFCWAWNAVFAEKLHLSKSRISHLISDLVAVGWIGRHIVLDDRTKQIQMRQLVAFDKLCEKEESIAKMKKLEDDLTEKGIRNRLTANAIKVGLNPLEVLGAIKAFGTERVENAIAIVRASNTVKNPTKYFFAAIKKGYKLGKRAERLIGKAFLTKKRKEIHPVDAVGAVRAESTNSTEKADFKISNPEFTEKFIQIVNTIRAKQRQLE